MTRRKKIQSVAKISQWALPRLIFPHAAFVCTVRGELARGNWFTCSAIYIVLRGAVSSNCCSSRFQNLAMPVVPWPRVSSLAGTR
jgi:hypothetical protein